MLSNLETMIKVSVIITTYNGEKTIERTLNSILNQQGINENFEQEVIVVDDCSTDNTIEILKGLNMMLYSTAKNSGGPNKGRNIGLGEASGDYICIVDQDDVWKKNRIASVIPYFDKAPIITSGYTVVDYSKGWEFDRVNASEEGYIFYQEDQTFKKVLTKALKGQNTYLGSIIFNKELKNILFEEEEGMVDFDWVLRLFNQRASIEICKSLFIRLVDSSNLSLNESYREKDFNYSLKFIETYREEYGSEVNTAVKKIHGSRARYYYLIGNMKKARYYFLRSQLTWKTFLYFITTYVGADYVKKRFKIFG